MPKRTKKQLRAWATKHHGGQLFEADGVDDSCATCCPEIDDVMRKGTLAISYRCSYEYEEYEVECAQCLYDEWHYWENLTDEQVKEMFADL
jgi:hypothetical protein